MNDKIKNERLKLEDVLEQQQQQCSPNETWISNTELIYLDSEGSLMIYDISTKWKTILASNASLVCSLLLFFLIQTKLLSFSNLSLKLNTRNLAYQKIVNLFCSHICCGLVTHTAESTATNCSALVMLKF